MHILYSPLFLTDIQIGINSQSVCCVVFVTVSQMMLFIVSLPVFCAITITLNQTFKKKKKYK